MRNDLAFPRYFSIQTTSFCNASCVFCPYQNIKDLFPKRIMDMDLYKRIIDECSKYKNIERIILYMNNEPLTDPYLIERINYAKEEVPWASVHILTNGLLLTNEITDKLLASKLDWIGISFHGVKKDTIEKSMGIDFEKSFANINRFIGKVRREKNIDEYLMITFLRHKYLSIEEKEEAIKFWQSKGIKRISYFDSPISRAGNVKDLPKVYHKEEIVGCKSIWADEMIHIVEDGKVVLCCMDWRREIILGDLNKESVYEVWNGKREEIWEMIYGRKEMPDNFLCRKCEEAISEDEADSILLINLPLWGVDTPYLGIASLATYLKEKGIHVNVFDFNIELYNLTSDKYKHLWSINYTHWWRDAERYSFVRKVLSPHIESLIEKLLCRPEKILGFLLPSNYSELILEEIVRRVKEKRREKVIILGGVFVSVREHRISLLKRIENYVDYCIVGEGEEPLEQLGVRLLRGTYPIQGEIRGVLCKKEFFEDREKVEILSMDNFPFPTFEEFDLTKYKVPNSLPIEFSRGCIEDCSFCDFKSVFPHFRTKSPFYILDQINYYIKKYRINHLSIVDPAINGDFKNLEKICDLLVENKISIQLTGLAIPRKEMTYEFLCKMKKAGFYRLEYGVESGSNKILKLMRKPFNKEIAERVIKDTWQAQIKTHLYFIVGFPGETEKEFRKTYNFIKRSVKYIDTIKSINTLHLIAGTEVYEEATRKFNMKPLPSKDWHYLWETYDGNTYKVRKRRAEILLNLAFDLGIRVMETNIMEGKENIFGDIKEKSFEKEQIELLKASINHLQSLPQKKEKIEEKRGIFKWMILVLVSLYTFFYIVYFWIHMRVRNKILLGGRVKRDS